MNASSGILPSSTPTGIKQFLTVEKSKHEKVNTSYKDMKLGKCTETVKAITHII